MSPMVMLSFFFPSTLEAVVNIVNVVWQQLKPNGLGSRAFWKVKHGVLKGAQKV